MKTQAKFGLSLSRTVTLCFVVSLISCQSDPPTTSQDPRLPGLMGSGGAPETAAGGKLRRDQTTLLSAPGPTTKRR